ncbi:MAG: MerR family transcriptional regulator, thiopeptide resistance regulator [Frankiales bacterium]|nr:MerR family transcriptional regulator, thiopeptide resistance regulator [Frankiales bacterium]
MTVDSDPFAPEAYERWGHTSEYAESRRRVSSYSPSDWERIHAAAADLEARLGAACAAGVDPASEAAMDLAEEHRQAICVTYYECPPAMHHALGEMYVEDERFAARYEAVAPGLTPWLRAAIAANTARHSPR